ncbi:acyltransferase domain protein [Mycobacterium kansasii]|uniref:Acyltransferase domain protein n=1 Tax=Mycobacterium kansasii TaxID=1768 RepID=A0A1V3WSE9_MYCKA|nr:acyltransferase domain protein [Mycobacterium kansasii]
MLSDPNGRASAEQIAAVVREIDEHRRAAGATGVPGSGEAPLSDLAQRVAAVAGFLRQRLTGDYSVDEFGFDRISMTRSFGLC